jgi:hypothetical protein
VLNLDDDVYEIPSSIVESLPPVWATKRAEETPAVCTLSTEIECPYCGESIRSVHVGGLTHGAGNSTMARLVVTCPECAGGLPPELAAR